MAQPGLQEVEVALCRIQRPPLVEHGRIEDQHARLLAHALGHAQARGAEQEIQPVDSREGALLRAFEARPQGVAQLRVQFGEPFEGQEMVLPRRAHAVRADEFEEGLEVAEDRSWTAGIDPLLLKYLRIALLGHDRPPNGCPTALISISDCTTEYTGEDGGIKGARDGQLSLDFLSEENPVIEGSKRLWH